MNKLKEARTTIGLQDQQIGYGKNYHTAHPEPITWENVSDLEHFVSAMPDGTFLAGMSLPASDFATPTYRFNSEADAMQWIRNASESFRVKKANQEQ